MKYIKILFASLLVMASLSVAVAGIATAQDQPANISNALCGGANLTNDITGDCETVTNGAGNNVNELVATIINIFSWVVGVVCVIMIIYGGFRYVTAGGDSANVTKAKDTILYAIIGLVIVALAQVIVKFVLSKVTS